MSDERLLSAEQLFEINQAVRFHLDGMVGGGLVRAALNDATKLLAHIDAQAEQLDELLAALRADPYFHGVWAWRQELQEGQMGYVRTPEVDRVLRAFAALGAYPATEPSEVRE